MISLFSKDPPLFSKTSPATSSVQLQSNLGRGSRPVASSSPLKGPHNPDQWLKTNLAEIYTQPDVTKKDILDAMAQYTDLRPKADGFTFSDGSLQRLVYLAGTIPVIFKGNIYNIPIKIWLQKSHPQSSPICFVKPTKLMQIRVSKHVDANGRIFLPYFSEWSAEACHNLIECIKVMTNIFSEEPPVFSKTSKSNTPSAQPERDRIPHYCSLDTDQSESLP